MSLSILLNCHSANSLPSSSAAKRELDRLPTDVTSMRNLGGLTLLLAGIGVAPFSEIPTPQ